MFLPPLGWFGLQMFSGACSFAPLPRLVFKRAGLENGGWGGSQPASQAGRQAASQLYLTQCVTSALPVRYPVRYQCVTQCVTPFGTRLPRISRFRNIHFKDSIFVALKHVRPAEIRGSLLPNGVMHWVLHWYCTGYCTGTALVMHCVKYS